MCEICGQYLLHGSEGLYSLSAGSAGTNQELATYLTTGFWSDFLSSPRKWNLSNSGTYAKNGVITFNTTSNLFDSDGLSASRATLVEESFKYLEAVTGIDFQSTTDIDSDFRFGDEESGASTSSSYLGGNINYVNINVESSWNGSQSGFGNYTFHTILHEIGHGLGLGHQGDYNESASYSNSSEVIFENDNWQTSVMSYIDQTENTSITADYAYLSSFMTTDLMAIDDLYSSFGYGISNAFSGDTTYGFNTNIASSTSSIFNEMKDWISTTAFTISDGSGTDTIDFSGFSNQQTIDLRASEKSASNLYSSNIAGDTGNLIIAPGTVIENAIGGTANDTLIGNSSSNNLTGNGGADTISGGDGDDILYGNGGADTLNGEGGNDTLNGDNASDAINGGSGDDTLYGGNGDDNLDGGTGDDTMVGGRGDDTYTIDSASDVVTESSSEGTDLIQSSVTFTASANVENLTLTGSSNIDATGNSLNNTLTGNSGNNTLDGGTGDDTMVGGNGDDTYTVDSASDVVTESSSEGTDLIQTSVTFTAPANVENLTLTGSSNIDATGNSLNNTLTGNSGNNTLDGGTGDDVAIFGNNLLDYSFTINSGDIQIIGEGTDTLKNIENIQFNDVTKSESQLRNIAEIPSISSFYPTDNSTSVLLDSNLVLTFSEAVETETGSITIYKSSNDEIFESFDVSTSPFITGSGTNTITINPTINFSESTEYYVNIDSTAFDDSAGNSYIGINNKTDFNFNTVSNDGSAKYAINGLPAESNTLSIKEISADPDGNGSLSYNWEISSDGNSWSSVSTSSEYTVTIFDEGKLIRVNLTYTDGEGFSESINAKGFYQSFNFDNNTSFSSLGVKSLNPASGKIEDLDISFSVGTSDSTWGYASSFARSSQTDFDSYSLGNEGPYTDFISSFSNLNKNFLEGEIIVFQNNPHTIVQIFNSSSRHHGDSIDGVDIRYTFFEGSEWTEAQRILYSDSGDAVFVISGTTQVSQELSITESTSDPDGTGTLSYVWQSSSDETTWSQIGTDSTYTLTSSEEGKKIRSIISYTDDQGFSESVTAESIEIPISDDGDAIFTISGTALVGQLLEIAESTSDPDGTGTLSYVWQSSSDETTWSQIGTDSTYTLTSSEEGKKIRAILSYTDEQGFSESVTVTAVDIPVRTYSLSTSINVPQEEYALTTTISTGNVAEGSTLYWSLSGTNITLSDFSDGALTGSGKVGSDGTFSFKHALANDGETEGYETINIKLFSDSERTTQVGETKSILIRDSAIEEKIAEIVEDLNGVKQVVSQLVKGQNYTLNNIRDYDGNLHANSADEDVSSSYKYQHALDVNGDGTLEAIYTNMKSGRWVTASINPLTGKVDYSDYGQNGTTRVVGIYDDPLIAEGAQNNGYLSDGVTPAPANFGVSDADRYVQYNGEKVDRLALNSQVRFQNDLKIDNLIAKKSNDFDSDGIREVYWKTSDGTAYLRALMHADGNIRYANYQSESQMTDYLTNNGLSDSITEIIS